MAMYEGEITAAEYAAMAGGGSSAASLSGDYEGDEDGDEWSAAYPSTPDGQTMSPLATAATAARSSEREEVCCGWLSKRAPKGMFKTWKRRYFVMTAAPLRGGGLDRQGVTIEYFVSDDRKTSKGFIEIDSVPEIQNKSGLKFTLV